MKQCLICGNKLTEDLMCINEECPHFEESFYECPECNAIMYDMKSFATQQARMIHSGQWRAMRDKQPKEFQLVCQNSLCYMYGWFILKMIAVNHANIKKLMKKK